MYLLQMSVSRLTSKRVHACYHNKMTASEVHLSGYGRSFKTSLPILLNKILQLFSYGYINEKKRIGFVFNQKNTIKLLYGRDM